MTTAKKSALTIDSLLEGGAFSLRVTTWIEDGGDQIGVQNWRCASQAGGNVAALLAQQNDALVNAGYPAVTSAAMLRAQAALSALSTGEADIATLAGATATQAIAATQGLATQVAALTTERDALQARLDALSAQGDVPTITKAQGLLVLKRHGLLSPLLAYMADQDPTSDIRIWFDNEPRWRRDHPAIATMAGEMSLDGDAVDALFAEGNTISS